MTANATTTPTAYNFKIVLLGEGCVGKTSLVLRYIEDKFNPQHISTLQASFVTKKVALGDGRRAQLNIWDTAGQERYHALGPIYYRGSQGAILVYDITDQDSFQKVKNWVRELKRMLGADITITIVGNKTDLEADRHVSYENAEQYAQSVEAHYYETSAKLNEGITELFEHLTRLMVARKDAQRVRETGSLRLLHGSRGLILEDNSNALTVGGRARVGDVRGGTSDNDEENDDTCHDGYSGYGPYGRTSDATNRSCCGAG